MRISWILVEALAVIAPLGCNLQSDMLDARAQAERIHAQMRAGDYVSIYKESAPRFKSVGTEAQFISLMQDFARQHGPIKKANEIAYETGVDTTAGRVHILVFEFEFENARTRERLTLTRSDAGTMSLYRLEIEPPTKQ
jgi:hypothetical protein